MRVMVVSEIRIATTKKTMGSTVPRTSMHEASDSTDE